MARWGGTQRRDWRERFIEKVDQRGEDECWPWLGAVNKATGYGVFGQRADRIVAAHVAAVEYATGKAPAKGSHVDHVRARGCVRKDCVNPAHLEVVTPRENARRAVSATCSRGHLRSEHSYTRPNGQRICRPCATMKQRELRRRNRVGQPDPESQ